MSHTRTSQHRRVPFPRMLGLDSNPLRRSTDRVEAWIRIAFILVFLISAPVTAVAVGRWSDTNALGAARAHMAAIHPVSATVLRSVPTANPDPARGALVWTKATWKAPDGASRTGLVQVQIGTSAGARVPIWVDRSGRVADPPLTRGQVVSRVVTAVALTPVAIGLLLAFIFGATVRIMERRRLRAWEAAWTAVEPQWTKRLH